jgi:hypothetical protein
VSSGPVGVSSGPVGPLVRVSSGLASGLVWVCSAPVPVLAAASVARLVWAFRLVLAWVLVAGLVWVRRPALVLVVRLVWVVVPVLVVALA